MKDKILKYNAQVPRYTSYPTAPHFQPVGEKDYLSALAAIDAAKDISLYVHVPFCREMCWYCGCHTTATRKYAPVEDYLSLLLREIAMVAEKLPGRLRVSHLHFGGGSPTMLQPEDFRRITDRLRRHFDFSASVEIAVEADPRGLTHDKAEAYAACGVNRMSFGIQDFAPEVQAAINRRQSFATVEKAVSLCRDFGIDHINFDLMYGLPKQTLAHVEDTVAKSLALSPGRIALFGYAHVPWMKKHMRLIHDSDLPGAGARIDQFSRAEQMLVHAGMSPVGLDHFAAPGDSMHRARDARALSRNFQGYTTDRAETLLGFGTSSIGRTAQGFFQNVANTTEYGAAILGMRLPVSRGCLTSAEDRLRADIISDLMCYLRADTGAILQRHGYPAGALDAPLSGLSDLIEDGLVDLQGGVIGVNAAARQIVRVVAARFDAYFTAQVRRHAQTA